MTTVMILVIAKYHSLIESSIRGVGHVACMGRKKLKERDCLKDIDVDGKTILNRAQET